jgi:hypothetical protein
MRLYWSIYIRFKNNTSSGTSSLNANHFNKKKLLLLTTGFTSECGQKRYNIMQPLGFSVVQVDRLTQEIFFLSNEHEHNLSKASYHHLSVRFRLHWYCSAVLYWILCMGLSTEVIYIILEFWFPSMVSYVIFIHTTN